MSGEGERGESVVTLLCSGVAGSVHLREVLADRHAAVLDRRLQIVREAVQRHGGRAVESAGDVSFAVFGDAREALTAAVEIQQRLDRELWPLGVHVRDRIGLHAGAPAVVDGRPVGIEAHRALRISAAASGGQILLSSAVRAVLDGATLPGNCVVRELGWYRLEALHYPEMLCDLVVPGLGDHFPPLRSLATRPTNLPSQSTAFIGRQQLVSDVRALLSSAGARLVTLTGVGGAGKTRLGLEVASGLLDAFADGVFQVSLSSVRDPDIVLSTIIKALSISEVPGRTAMDSVIHQLASKKTLLLLDGLEQSVAAGPLVAQLLASCKQLALLVTSRAALSVRFEREVAVPRLQLPGDSPQPAFALRACEAAELFVDRVRDLDRAIALTADDRATIEDICTRLDGWPLAIELAGRQVATLTLQELAARLRSRLDLLPRDRGEVATPERALRVALESSYGLLDPARKALFRRAAVFAGDFALDTAQDVLAAPDCPGDGVVSGLESLVTHGLLVRETACGDARLRMLEPVRAYGLEQLRACDENAGMRAAHARHFVELAERLSPCWTSCAQRGPVQRTLAESDNLRAALSFALETRDSFLLSRMLHALSWLWISRCRFDEARVWAEHALRVASQQPDSREHGQVLAAAGCLSNVSGDHEQALQRCQRALGILERVGTPAEIARTKLTLGISSTVLGRVAAGRALLIDALSRHRELGEPEGTALCLIALGDGARAEGDEASARPRYEEALSILRGVGDVYWSGQVLQALAHVRLHLGDHAGAARLLAEALELGREYDYPMVMNLYVAAMGGVGVVRGRLRDAARLFGAAIAALQQLGATLQPLDQQALERDMAATRSSLGDEVFEAAFAEGSHFSLDQAIALTAALRR